TRWPRDWSSDVCSSDLASPSVKRGEIYRTQEKVPERGHKPGFYVVVSRNFIARNDDVSTVICTPVYSEILGLRSEVVLGVEDGQIGRASCRERGWMAGG